MKVYVAGPDVFRKDAKAYLETVRTLLSLHGMTALVPLDNEVESGPEVDVPAEIYKGNVKMIDECDVVLANIVPFRGAHMDPGTAFEVGYAAAKGKTIYAYTPHAHSSLYDRVKAMDALEETNSQYDLEGNMVENFGETENLMITVPTSCIFPTLEQAVKALKANLGS